MLGRWCYVCQVKEGADRSVPTLCSRADEGSRKRGKPPDTLPLHNEGLVMILGRKGSPEHECCCAPLYVVNFSVTSTEAERACLLHAVGHCMEILWADWLMKHIVMQTHQYGAGKSTVG